MLLRTIFERIMVVKTGASALSSAMFDGTYAMLLLSHIGTQYRYERGRDGARWRLPTPATSFPYLQGFVFASSHFSEAIRQ
jgi:hypothetical protein